MIIPLWLVLAAGLSGDCYLDRGPDSTRLWNYPDLNSIRSTRDSVLQSYRNFGDTSEWIPAIERDLRFGDVDARPMAFWTAIYRDKGVSQVYLSVEFWAAHASGVYKAYAVFRSGDKYWFAAWDDVILMATGVDQRAWQVGDQVNVAYRQIFSDTVTSLLKHIDSAYNPLDRHVLLDARQPSGSFAYVSVNYCGKANTYFVVSAELPTHDSHWAGHILGFRQYDELFDYQGLLCGTPSKEVMGDSKK
jgi:hypothetical protein